MQRDEPVFGSLQPGSSREGFRVYGFWGFRAVGRLGFRLLWGLGVFGFRALGI